MTLSSLSYVVSVDPYQGNNGVMPSLYRICVIFGIRPSLSHPITKAEYVELIGGRDSSYILAKHIL